MRGPGHFAWSRAWTVVALLFPVALLNYLDRQMLATMRPSIVADLPALALQADWGLALGMFKWTYALLSPAGGWAADRWGRAPVIAGSLLVWSAVTWWTGHVGGFGELLAARAAMGLSEACYFPAALALIADHHGPGTRSRATGWHQTGVYCGQILGGFAGYAAASPGWGWRGTFAACGGLGMAYAVPLFFGLRAAATPSRPTSPLTVAVGAEPAAGRRALWANRNFRLLLLYFTLPAIAGWIVRDWMPAILRERFGLGQGQAGVSAVLFVQVAALVGVVLGGVAADRWARRTVRGRIFTSALGVLLFLPALVSVGFADRLPVALLGLVLFGLGWGCFDGNNMPILCQIVPAGARATAYGWMNLVSLGCGGLGDWLFGVLRDRQVPLPAIFGVFAGIALVSVGIALRLRPTGKGE